MRETFFRISYKKPSFFSVFSSVFFKKFYSVFCQFWAYRVLGSTVFDQGYHFCQVTVRHLLEKSAYFRTSRIFGILWFVDIGFLGIWENLDLVFYIETDPNKIMVVFHWKIIVFHLKMIILYWKMVIIYVIVVWEPLLIWLYTHHFLSYFCDPKILLLFTCVYTCAHSSILATTPFWKQHTCLLVAIFISVQVQSLEWM